MTINSIRFGPLYVELELELVELDPKDDLELEPESELEIEIENEEGLLGLTSLCPAVGDELTGGDEAMVRVSSAAKTVVRVKMIGESFIGASILVFSLRFVLLIFRYQNTILRLNWSQK